MNDELFAQRDIDAFSGMAGAVALFTRDGKEMNRCHSNCQTSAVTSAARLLSE